MSESPNAFFWYELMTSDPDAAKAFYGAVCGWDAKAFDASDTPYTVFEVDGRGVGGAMELPAEGGARPCWVGYIHVGDVDGAAGRLAAAGGTIHRAPEDIPGVGRFAAVADPQGAVFMLMTPDGADQPPVAQNTPGHFGWHELYANDGTGAFDFYAAQYGWTKDHDLDMGEMGIYRIFSMGSYPLGGMMTRPPFMPAPFWLFYVNVDGTAETAAKRITDHGGTIVHGPSEVPGPMWIVQATDPQGVMFAVVAGAK